MEFDPKDIDVVALLAKLRSADVQYPSDLFASRRLAYTRMVAEIGLGLGVAPGLKSTGKTGSSGSGLTKVGRVFETLLVAAIVAEASAAVYFYREDIAEFIQSYRSSTAESESIPSPDNASPLPEAVGTEPSEASATPRVTLTNTPTGTATVVPTVVVENSGANDQANSTPSLKGNNGNQYGKTPKPERTKENDNNDNGSGKDKDK